MEEFDQQFKDLTWSVTLSNGVVVPLSNHSLTDPVEYKDRTSYTRDAVKRRLLEYKYQILAFIEGFNLSIPSSVFQIYTWNNLEEVITGINDIDISLLESLTMYACFSDLSIGLDIREA